jgi:anti-sigma B factor antagonist
MLSSITSAPLEVKQAGTVTVVNFVTSRLWGEGATDDTGEQLFSLVDEEKCRQVLLNFNAVKRLDSSMMGKLITLHKKLKAAGGRLAICNLRLKLGEIFRTLKLHRYLNLYGDEQEALQTFA